MARMRQSSQHPLTQKTIYHWCLTVQVRWIEVSGMVWFSHDDPMVEIQRVFDAQKMWLHEILVGVEQAGAPTKVWKKYWVMWNLLSALDPPAFDPRPAKGGHHPFWTVENGEVVRFMHHAHGR